MGTPVSVLDVKDYLENLNGVVGLHSLLGGELRKDGSEGAVVAAKTLELPGAAIISIPEVSEKLGAFPEGCFALCFRLPVEYPV